MPLPESKTRVTWCDRDRPLLHSKFSTVVANSVKFHLRFIYPEWHGDRGLADTLSISKRFRVMSLFDIHT